MVSTLVPGNLSDLLAELVAPGAPRASPEAVLHPGMRVRRFELVVEIGRGGFSVVYEALDTELGRRVAFKALRPGARTNVESGALLQREARAIAQLQHPNVVTLHDLGLCDAGPFLVLELLRGETLSQRLAKGRISARETMRIASGVCAALAHAHAHGVLHRDLKPSNVFLAADGAVKVLDFGLAHVFGLGGPRGSGTPRYMAPEQQRKEAEDDRTDLYALGILVGQALTGEEPPILPANLAPWLASARAPEPLVRLAARCARADPAERPASAAAVGEELARLRAALELSRPRERPVAASGPALEALRQLFLGEECASRPAFGTECAGFYRRAIDLDPTLPAAHYGLAIWTRRFGGTAQEQRQAIAGAISHQDRAAPPQRALTEALAAQLEGDDEGARGILREAIERWPDDPRAWYELGDLLRHQDELTLALPYLAKAVELAPERGWAPGQLAEVLGALGRAEALRVAAERWARAPSPVTLHALSIAAGWLGDLAGAEAAARRGVALGSGVVAQQDLLAALVAQGSHAEAEEVSRGLADSGSPVRRIGHYALTALDAYRGRFAAGCARLAALASAVPGIETDAFYHAVRADYLAGAGDPGPVRDAAEALDRVDPRAAAELAPTLAWLGDLPLAARLASALRPGSPASRTHDALAAWGRGARDEALALLRGVVADAPIALWRIAPLWFLSDLEARAGHDAEATAALERLEGAYVPRMMWRAWAHPRSLLLLHRCRRRLGDEAGAEAALRRLEADLAAGDPADPLVREVRALTSAESAPPARP